MDNGVFLCVKDPNAKTHLRGENKLSVDALERVGNREGKFLRKHEGI